LVEIISITDSKGKRLKSFLDRGAQCGFRVYGCKPYP